MPYRARLALICLVAASVSLPISIISICKLLLLLGSLWVLLPPAFAKAPSPAAGASITALRTPIATLVALATMAISLTWTEADLYTALNAWQKHAKLLTVPLLLLLIRSPREANMAMLAFLAGQAFLLLSSWMLVAGLPVPWATARGEMQGYYAVFSSRLDQPIMSSLSGALAWYLGMTTQRHGLRVALLVLSVLSFVHVLFVMQGRTGHVIALCMMSLIFIRHCASRHKLWLLLLPVLLVGVVLGSPPLKHRMDEAVKEVVAYSQGVQTPSSSGERLNYSYRSLQAIDERPWLGHGVGAWNLQYNRFENGQGLAHTHKVMNPHQEFLLWTVEAGVLGLLALLGWLATIYRDARPMTPLGRRCVEAALLATVVACLFNSALYDAVIGDFLCVALALTMALGRDATRTTEPSFLR